jgi:hypothetical protein
MGAKEDESITGRVWADGFHHVTDPFSLGARFETYVPFFLFSFFSGRGKPQILNQLIPVRSRNHF